MGRTHVLISSRKWPSGSATVGACRWMSLGFKDLRKCIAWRPLESSAMGPPKRLSLERKCVCICGMEWSFGDSAVGAPMVVLGIAALSRMHHGAIKLECLNGPWPMAALMENSCTHCEFKGKRGHKCNISLRSQTRRRLEASTQHKKRTVP